MQVGKFVDNRIGREYEGRRQKAEGKGIDAGDLILSSVGLPVTALNS